MPPHNTKAERRAASRLEKSKTSKAKSPRGDFRKVKPVEETYQPRAKSDGFRVKSKTIELLPKNPAQARYIDALYDEGRDVIFATGPAGTGKTYIPSLYALREFKDGGYERIIITRPIVPNGEDLGFLPGDLIEKLSPWVRPILDTFQEVMDKSEITALIEKGSLEIAPLSMMRGRTFKNAIIICDEAQNATAEQMKMLLTRIGEGSRMIITGDLEQRDRIDGACGLLDFIDRMAAGPSRLRNRFSHVAFEPRDVERHPVISDILSLYELET